MAKDKLLRVRFYCNLEDPRPVNWPIKFPYWVTGEDDKNSIVVAYADSIKYIMDNWPDAIKIESSEVEEIVFTDRFPRPKWYSLHIQ